MRMKVLTKALIVSLLLPVSLSASAAAGSEPRFLSEDEYEAALEAALPVGRHVPGMDAEWIVKARFKESTLHGDLMLTLTKIGNDDFALDIAWVVGGDVYSQVRRARPKDAADAARVARGLVVRRIRASAACAKRLAELGAAMEAMKAPLLPRYFEVSHPEMTVVTMDYFSGNFLRLEWFGAGVAYDDVPLMRWLADLRSVALKEIAAVAAAPATSQCVRDARPAA